MARDLAGGIQQLAYGVQEAGVPFDMELGTVISVSPLQIQIDEKKTVGAAQLLLSSLVRDFDMEMTVDHTTEDALGITVDGVGLTHRHAYKGNKTFTVHLGLKEGEQVMLLRCKGGQRFIVLDRVRG